MVTRKYTGVLLYHENGDVDKEIEVFCESTDEKPHDVPNTTIAYEMDTGDVYMYSVSKDDYIKQKFE